MVIHQASSNDLISLIDIVIVRDREQLQHMVLQDSISPVGTLSSPSCASVNVLNLCITHHCKKRSCGNRCDHPPNLQRIKYNTYYILNH